MKVSVVIPALNEESCIERAVSSAWISGASEVVVVDGGSRDSTCRCAAAAGARVLSSPPGRAAQQNVGAKSCVGEVLLFLHADCRLPEDGVAQIDEALGDLSVVGGSFRQRIEAASERPFIEIPGNHVMFSIVQALGQGPDRRQPFACGKCSGGDIRLDVFGEVVGRT